MLTKVTMTGADDSVRPEQLVELQQKYPFVEWGILVSRDRFGTRRFPSIKWLNELSRNEENLFLSCHLCGYYVRDIFRGGFDFIKDLPDIKMFSRIQLNTHGEPHTFNVAILDILNRLPYAYWIFQQDGVNKEVFEYVTATGGFERNSPKTENLEIQALFDLSHGAGVLPAAWPEPIEGISCGYAGGLGPENLEEQIEKIFQIAGVTERNDIWIDMETRIRSNNDMLFDLERVEKCLEIAAKYTAA